MCVCVCVCVSTKYCSHAQICDCVLIRETTILHSLGQFSITSVAFSQWFIVVGSVIEIKSTVHPVYHVVVL